jgi:hypothetical protein
MPLPAAAGLVLSEADRKEFRGNDSSSQHSTRRCSAYQHCSGRGWGKANRMLARELGTSVPTVLLWRKR